MTAYIEFLRKNYRIVQSWPAWKRNVSIYNTYREIPTLDERCTPPTKEELNMSALTDVEKIQNLLSILRPFVIASQDLAHKSEGAVPRESQTVLDLSGPIVAAMGEVKSVVVRTASESTGADGDCG